MKNLAYKMPESEAERRAIVSLLRAIGVKKTLGPNDRPWLYVDSRGDALYLREDMIVLGFTETTSLDEFLEYVRGVVKPEVSREMTLQDGAKATFLSNRIVVSEGELFAVFNHADIEAIYERYQELRGIE